MELPPFDDISKIWAPTKKELQEFCLTNKYVRQMHGDILTKDDGKEEDDSIAKVAEPGPSSMSSIYGELPIHTFLYKLIKKDIYYTSEDHPGSGVHIMEEEAIVLSGMLAREGLLFEDLSEEPGCMVCATERLEKDLMDMMKRQLQLTKTAREYYTKPENEERYNICANHRVFNPRNCIPNGVNTRQHHGLRPELVAELFRTRSEYTDPFMNYCAGQNFPIASSPNLPRSQDFRAEMELIEMGSQSNPAINQAQSSNPQMNNFGPQVPNSNESISNSMPDLFSVQTSTFVPNRTISQNGTSNNFPRATTASNYLNRNVTQDSASNFIPNRTVNQPVLNNFMLSRANNQTPVSNYLANNITSQNSPNYVSNRNVGQNLAPNIFSNNLAPTSSNNYIPANINGKNNNLFNLVHPVANHNQIHNRSIHLSNPNLLSNSAQPLNMNPSRQALINNAVNNIANDLHDQLLAGTRGRKILGKKY